MFLRHVMAGMGTHTGFLPAHLPLAEGRKLPGEHCDSKAWIPLLLQPIWWLQDTRPWVPPLLHTNAKCVGLTKEGQETPLGSFLFLSLLLCYMWNNSVTREAREPLGNLCEIDSLLPVWTVIVMCCKGQRRPRDEYFIGECIFSYSYFYSSQVITQ